MPNDILCSFIFYNFHYENDYNIAHLLLINANFISANFITAIFQNFPKHI